MYVPTYMSASFGLNVGQNVEQIFFYVRKRIPKNCTPGLRAPRRGPPSPGSRARPAATRPRQTSPARWRHCPPGADVANQFRP
jgi:hypothetical protein